MVNSIGNPYGVGLYVPPGASQTPGGAAGAYGRAAGGSTTGYGASVMVTLSPEARAALAAQSDGRTLEDVTAAARTTLDRLLAAAKAPSALNGGRPSIDVSSMDRRSLYAVASNAGGKFTLEEQVVAALQMSDARDAALKGPAAAARVTGDYAGLYQAWLANLDAAGAEEKGSSAWSDERAAVVDGLKQAAAAPGRLPSEVENDPVAAWLKANGGVAADPRKREAGALAADVRAALDRQYALAGEPDMARDPDSGQIDFSRFDDRSLSLIALNSDGAFSEHEAQSASAQVRQRGWDAVSSAYKASSGGDASAFGRSLISRYAAMSDEERQASGWTPELYSKMVALQDTADKLASLFGPNGATGGGASLVDYL